MITPENFAGGEAGEQVPFEADVTGLNDNYRDILASEYGLGVIGDRLTGALTPERHHLATVDVGFVKVNPTVPAENVVSRLDNYTPNNTSQAQMHTIAKRLVGYHAVARMAGVIFCGPAGVGKTHIAVGCAKFSLMQGQKTFYMNMERTGQVANSKMAERVATEADFVIIDDMNSVLGGGADFFRSLVSAMHDKGNGKLMVTSNFASPGDLIHGLMNGPLMDAAAKARLYDRIAGGLLGHVVEGDSYRQKKRDTNGPWWMEESPAQRYDER